MPMTPVHPFLSVILSVGMREKKRFCKESIVLRAVHSGLIKQRKIRKKSIRAGQLDVLLLLRYVNFKI